MKGRGEKKLKHVNLKIEEATSKNVAITAKKEKQFVHTPTTGIYLQKLPLKLTYRWTSCSMWCSREKKYFCKGVEINDNGYEWLQITLDVNN